MNEFCYLGYYITGISSTLELDILKVDLISKIVQPSLISQIWQMSSSTLGKGPHLFRIKFLKNEKEREMRKNHNE